MTKHRVEHFCTVNKLRPRVLKFCDKRKAKKNLIIDLQESKNLLHGEHFLFEFIFVEHKNQRN